MGPARAASSNRRTTGSSRPKQGAALRTRLELQRNAIQAVTKAGRCRAVIEDMTEMRAASRAKNFVAFHPEAVVFHGRDDSGNERLRKTGPTGSGFEFGVAREQRRIATGAVED